MEQKTLKIDQKLETSYCIPLWLRDLQIQQNSKRIKKRVEPGEKQKDPIAVVCFGPSLKKTWKKIKDYKYIITCSGSHKFLVDRGIIPTYHLDVDPREHKIGLMGKPQQSTKYLIASTCSPKLLDHLEGYDVALWHIFDNTENAATVLPIGEFTLFGGCSAGLRAMTMAAFLGFRDLHIFGMDGGSLEKEKTFHADKHPNTPKKYYLVEYPENSGKMWKTTPSLLEAARQTFAELDTMPGVKAKFYGTSLVKEMSKHYKPKIKTGPLSDVIAVCRPELISDEYKKLNQELHEENLLYGVGGGKHAKTVVELAKTLIDKDNLFISVLDYGCGKGQLAKELPFPIQEYDPAIPGKEQLPKPADLVVCTDVLEHIEPDKLDFVLDDLKRCVKKIGYFVIHTGPSSKKLSDGRNTHLIQEDKDWWYKKLSLFFTLAKNSIIERQPLLYIIVGPKNQKFDLKEKIHAR